MIAKGVFLESLESYIVANRLCHLTTPIMKDLLAHYHDSGMMDSLERCIVHLDVTNLDIQQVNACIGTQVNKPKSIYIQDKEIYLNFFPFLSLNEYKHKLSLDFFLIIDLMKTSTTRSKALMTALYVTLKISLYVSRWFKYVGTTSSTMQ